MIIEDLSFNSTDISSVLEVEYPVMEHFHTLQGEGAHTGRAAYFIRLAGCDVGCSWCDVKDSWDADKHPRMSVKTLVDAALNSKAPIVVITGGEPLLHDLTALTQALHQAGCKIHLETSGSSPMSGSFDWVTLSPKRFKSPVDAVYPYVDELKVVVVNKKDFDWAEMHAERCPEGTVLLLQPEWDSPKTMPWITEYVMQHPKWGVSLQTHKFLGIP